MHCGSQHRQPRKEGGREGGRNYVPEHTHDEAIPHGIGKEDRIDQQLPLLHRRLLHHVWLGLLAGQAQGLREGGREGEREGKIRSKEEQKQTSLK